MWNQFIVAWRNLNSKCWDIPIHLSFFLDSRKIFFPANFIVLIVCNQFEVETDLFGKIGSLVEHDVLWGKCWRLYSQFQIKSWEAQTFSLRSHDDYALFTLQFIDVLFKLWRIPPEILGCTGGGKSYQGVPWYLYGRPSSSGYCDPLIISNQTPATSLLTFLHQRPLHWWKVNHVQLEWPWDCGLDGVPHLNPWGWRHRLPAKKCVQWWSQTWF